MSTVTATEIVEGARRLFDLAQNVSESNPAMAMGQLLLAAGVLARAIGMDHKDFMAGANAAWEDGR